MRCSVNQRLAYFTNQYPAISHTFIRREVRALENLGWDIRRFTIRQCSDLVDNEDLEEAARTTALLPLKIGNLLAGLVLLLGRPVRTSRAVAISIAMALRSDRGFLRSVFAFIEAIVLLGELSREKVAHCHAHFGTNSTTVVRIVHALGGPSYSFTNHGPFEIDNPYALSLSNKVEDASFVVAISDFARAQLLRITPPRSWPKIHVVRCGLDFDTVPKHFVDLPRTHQLISIGRLSVEKGHLILLRAIAQLVHEEIPVCLTLVGDGPLRTEIESEINELGLSEVVSLSGNADGAAVERFIQGSRACVLSSLAEGLPVVLMEAFRAGRPVIATNIGGIGELVEHGVSGWLVPPGNAVLLAGAMRGALELPVEALGNMGRAGYEKVRRMHNVTCEAEKLSHLFERAIHTAKQPVTEISS